MLERCTKFDPCLIPLFRKLVDIFSISVTSRLLVKTLETVPSDTRFRIFLFLFQLLSANLGIPIQISTSFFRVCADCPSSVLFMPCACCLLLAAFDIARDSQMKEFEVSDVMSTMRLCEITDGGHFFVHKTEGGDLARIEAKLKELKDKASP